MNERRIARLQEQIKQRLAEVLQREINDPKLGLVTVTRVELDSEFTTCKAYWSVVAPTKAAEAKARMDSESVLRRASGFCQREVGKALRTRTIPHLEFLFDEGIAGAIRVNQLLEDLRHERELRGDSTTVPAPETPAPETPATGTPAPLTDMGETPPTPTA
ncbi:MAG: 30S ribosome-binding factor RbfA [Planctomycetota bacterium]